MCDWKHCKKAPELTWRDRAICWPHWIRVCELRDAGQTADQIRAEHAPRRRTRRHDA